MATDSLLTTMEKKMFSNVAKSLADKTNSIITKIQDMIELEWFSLIDSEEVDGKGTWKEAFFSDYFSALCESRNISEWNMRQRIAESREETIKQDTAYLSATVD